MSHTLFHWEQFTVDVFEEQRRGVSFRNEVSLRPALIKAMGLGRSTRLAESADGRIIDTAVRVPDAAEDILKTTCIRCKLLSSGLE